VGRDVEVHAVDVDAGDVGLEMQEGADGGAEAEVVDAEHRGCGLAQLLLEVGLGGTGEIEDAEAVAFDLEALGDGDIEGVQLDGRVEAVAEGGDEAAAEDGADVVGDVLGCEDGGEQEDTQEDAKSCEPTVASAVRAMVGAVGRG
jgi:hypothetical protein